MIFFFNPARRHYFQMHRVGLWSSAPLTYVTFKDGRAVLSSLHIPSSKMDRNMCIFNIEILFEMGCEPI